ncbi:MAG: lytic transglycosylase domain-containing protein [Actinomycetota bacterium]|nr:lytic transglycosylase domain-containing protein [Actinomycetota bacterium]
MLLVALALAGASSACAQTVQPTPAPPPPFDPNQRIPTEPGALAGTIWSNTTTLHSEIDRWRAEGDPSTGPAPNEVTLRAVFHQRLHLLLTDRPRLYRTVVKRLPPKLAADARDIVSAKRSLRRLAGSGARRRTRTGPALPADRLLAHYREAEARFRVRPRVLASINLIESGFNRIRNNSTAGAQGPMQFIPSTWRAYGMGGNIRDPHDAILGAANYLRASGAPRAYRRALYAYNHSGLYVEAVLRYAKAIARDPHTFYVLHSWHIFVRSGSGFRRITGPGPR